MERREERESTGACNEAKNNLTEPETFAIKFVN